MKTGHLPLGRIITPATVRRAGSGDFPILSMTMRDGLVNQSEKFKKRIASADTSPYKVVERNQLVVGFPIDEGVLAFQRLYDEAIVSPAYNIWTLQDDSLVSGKYLERFLRSPRAMAFYASKLRSTTARRRTLPNDIFLSLPVPVPPLPEQERIVKLLDEADALNKLRIEADERTGNLIPALFYQTFGEPNANSQKWANVRLGDVIFAAQDGPHVSPKYSDSGIPILSTRHIKQGKVNWNDLKFLDQNEADLQWKKCKPQKGDVLYTKGGTTGIAAAVTFDKPIAVWVHVALLKTDHTKVDPIWLENMLNSSYCYLQSQELTHGIANRDLGLKRMTTIKMFLPPLQLQQMFAKQVSAIREIEEGQATSSRYLEELFQSILQRAFEGHL